MSDAFTDISRSDDISRYTDRLLGAEVIFLADPTSENLRAVYQICDRLERCPTGYWHDSTHQDIARTAREHYQRFESGDIKPGVEDLALLLSQCSDEKQLKCMAYFVSLAQGIHPNDEGFYGVHRQNIEFLKTKLTMHHGEEIQNRVKGERLRQILKEAGLEDIFPMFSLD